MAEQKSKKKNKKNIPSGVAHIKASFNNTIINISDTNGETVVWTSGGSVGFKGSRKSTHMLPKLQQKRLLDEQQNLVYTNWI